MSKSRPESKRSQSEQNHPSTPVYDLGFIPHDNRARRRPTNTYRRHHSENSLANPRPFPTRGSSLAADRSIAPQAQAQVQPRPRPRPQPTIESAQAKAAALKRGNLLTVPNLSFLLNPPTYNSNHQTSFNWRAGRAMAGMMDLERSRTRRERTFIGAECAVCEEPLEHTLRGERVLQFSCAHVSHEACFYEYIKEIESQYCPTCNAPLGLDTSRGGNILDLEKLSSIVRAIPVNDYRNRGRDDGRSAQNTPTPWDKEYGRERPRSRESHRPEMRRSRESRERIERFASKQQQGHGRNDSGTTGKASSADYSDHPHSMQHARKHDYDVQSMETTLSSPRSSMAKNPIPSPIVTVRSEFPTLNRSRQQQTLTCLVTVEVADGKWRPDPEDIQGAPSVPPLRPEEGYRTSQSPVRNQQQQQQQYHPYDSPEALEEVTEDLRVRVENWHGLDFQRFGRLRLHGTVRVGKDRQSWQELECYLFAEMLICVKEKKGAPPIQWEEGDIKRKNTRCALKGSILIKKHLKQVNESQETPVLTLSLSVAELPSFHLQFKDRAQLELWRRALLDLNSTEPLGLRSPVVDNAETSETDEEDYRTLKTTKRVSSVPSSYGANKSANTAPTEYTNSVRDAQNSRLPPSFHVPLDLVVVIPVTSSMHGLKISLLRDALKFLVQNLGERDRMGLVTFGSGGGGLPLVGMTTKAWGGWTNILNSIKPASQKSLRADIVEGANVAMDLLMQRKASNPIASIFLVSDASSSDIDSVDFVVSRAEAAKVAIHSFGLGLTHKPDTMIELSTRTKASYTYVKDWMMLRECVAGALGSMQTMSHQNVKLKLKLPEGSPAKFVKISGALQITKRAAGKDAEAALGDLRFGDKRDILVHLVIKPENPSQENLPQDAWESIVSGLEALGGPLEQDDQRTMSVEEVPLIQADLTFGDILRGGILAHQPRPSLLAITMLPGTSKSKQTGRPITPPIPPHPSIVQRRMELLTSDMLTRALTLVSRGQHERAQTLLNETRSILKGLGKGGLPPIPPPAAVEKAQGDGNGASQAAATNGEVRRTPSPPQETMFNPGPGIDAQTVQALDAELESSLEWIGHPAVFGRDSRKAVLQAIGIISSQRGYTFRSPVESLWANRITGIKKLTAKSREWREADESLMEEA